MRQRLVRAAALLCGALLPTLAAAQPSFDYWMLALSWSPQYCESRQQPDEPQCRREFHFVVHGLWPQYERGFPRACAKVAPVPQPLVERLLPLMPSPKLIEHEWRQHGSCSGMGVQEYFLQTERARRRIAIPPVYEAPRRLLVTSVGEIERQFIDINPGITPEALALSCSGRWLSEVRVCLDKDFNFRACGEDVRDRCRKEVAIRPSTPGRLR